MKRRRNVFCCILFLCLFLARPLPSYAASGVFVHEIEQLVGLIGALEEADASIHQLASSLQQMTEPQLTAAQESLLDSIVELSARQQEQLTALLAELESSQRLAWHEPVLEVLPAPTNLTAYREHVGETFLFHVTASTAGTVWGTDIYTDDSRLEAAVIHAGLLQEGESGHIYVTILPGQTEYTASTRHGMTSHSYRSWHGSYRLSSTHPGQVKEQAPVLEVLPAPTNLTAYRQHVGETFLFDVTASSSGNIWGTDTYTDDSRLAAVVIHAGLLRSGESGHIYVTILPAQTQYLGSTSHGLTSRSYGSWHGSYQVSATYSSK